MRPVVPLLRNALRALIIGVLIISSAGCEENVSPFVEGDQFFTIFGFLDTATDEQMVRVVPLRTAFAASGNEPIDAVVRTTAVESGEVVVWRDSVVTFEDGSFGHVFIGDYRPIPGWTYRFEVERSDGKTSSATTTVPPASNVEVGEPIFANQGVSQRVTWSDVDARPFRVEVWYRFLSSPTKPFDNGIVVYGDADGKIGQSTGSDAWEVLVRLSDDREDALNDAGFSSEAAPFLMSVGMRLTMTDNEWRPPDGVFDREVLVQPGTFSNVENGFGFFGSLNQFTVEWTVSEAVIQRMGYQKPQ